MARDLLRHIDELGDTALALELQWEKGGHEAMMRRLSPAERLEKVAAYSPSTGCACVVNGAPGPAAAENAP